MIGLGQLAQEESLQFLRHVNATCTKCPPTLGIWETLVKLSNKVGADLYLSLYHLIQLINWNL